MTEEKESITLEAQKNAIRANVTPTQNQVDNDKGFPLRRLAWNSNMGTATEHV